MAAPFCIPASREWEFLLSAPAAASGVVSVPDFGHCHSCAMISYCFNLNFNDTGCGTSFHILSCHCVPSLVRHLFKVFGPSFTGLFLLLLLSFKSSLYISDNSPLSYMSFANTFSHSMACLFYLIGG